MKATVKKNPKKFGSNGKVSDLYFERHPDCDCT